MNAHRRTHASLLMLMLLLGAPGLLTRSARAQDTLTLSANIAPSATLLRRLAEAVDAQRHSRPVWVVIQRELPHDVLGVFETRDQATSAGAARAGYALLGPFITKPDSGLSAVMYGIVECPGEHDPMSQCSDTTFSLSSVAMAQQDVDSIVITIYGRRPPIRRKYRPTQVDAVFFTLSAIDKFAMPYYTRVYGPARALRMREYWLRRVR
jgi:hypothetical protein